MSAMSQEPPATPRSIRGPVGRKWNWGSGCEKQPLRSSHPPSTETHSRCAPEFQEPGTHANLEDKPGTSRALGPEADPTEREV